jgi:hypothetical protein
MVNPKELPMAMDGKRGGVGEIAEDGVDGVRMGCGRSGRVIDGAGLGEGMLLRESRERRIRRGEWGGTSWMLGTDEI